MTTSITLRFELRDENSLSASERIAIRRLLNEAFPGCSSPEQTGRRMLVWHHGELVGQMGIESRTVGFEGTADSATVYGVVDLAVAHSARGQGLASRMLAMMESLGQENAVEFVVLFAPNTALYEKNSYVVPNNLPEWAVDSELPTMMVKALGNRAWPARTVDLLSAQAA